MISAQKEKQDWKKFEGEIVQKNDNKMDPFTNQPYSFDDPGSNPREVEFNNGIREITVRIKIFKYYFCYFK